MFLGGNKPHVPLRKILLAQFWHSTQDGKVAVVFNACAQDLFMPGTGNPIEDHPFDIDSGVELHAAQNRCGHGAGRLGAIDTQHNRRLQKFGKLRRTGAPLDVNAVVKTPVALNDSNIIVAGMS